MSPQALAAWERLNATWGKPLTVNSAYRDPAQNAAAKGAKRSQHMHGNAFDVSTAGMSPEDRAALVQAAKSSGFTGYGGYNNSLHFDVGPSRTWGADYTGAATPDWLKVALGGGAPATQGRTSTRGSQPMAQPMQQQQQQQQQPMGILEMMGVQKRDPSAQDQTALPFYQRDQFKNAMGGIAMAANTLSGRPDENLAAQVQAGRQRRGDAQARNKTVEYLRANGREDLASMVEQGMISGKDAAGQLLAKGAAGEIREVDGRLVRVMPDNSVIELTGGGSQRKAPTVTTITNADGAEVAVQWDSAAGQWVPLDTPEGSVPTPPKLTEGQAKTTLFSSMQSQTAPVLDSIEQQWNPSNLPDAIARSTPIAGNFFASSQGQIYNAAAEAWAEGALRIATGAAATPDEKASVRGTYFAKPGDTPETVSFKNNMRKAYEEAINASLGRPTGYQLPIPQVFAAGPNASPVFEDPNAELDDILKGP